LAGRDPGEGPEAVDFPESVAPSTASSSVQERAPEAW